ncbi:YoaK family protein [Flavobacterium sp.]|uniref:YoaK family protein n=1 Tax=Flavobacterium sp. TaxID=239 RepID=UPI002604F0F0|nr:YoaK family protein [Flavobacterium sp.]
MFRHKGNRRTFAHNLRLASTLSFIAGIVNIAGVLSVATLTTNVTGHFAFFAEEIALKNYSKAITILIYIFFFLFGAFTSNFIVEITSIKKPRIAHTLPMLLEIVLLAFVGLSQTLNPNNIAYLLLFAMGLQNALVTNISQSVVRTTHLTGLFTDLGIELSQLFFYKKEAELKRLTRNISLRLSIITFFFIGCVLGGLLYETYKLKILILAAVVLFLALFFDNLAVYYNLTKRKIKSNLH